MADTDLFGLESDFGAPQAIPGGKPDQSTADKTPKIVEGTATTPKFRQEIDLKDGSGVQVFEADTAVALVEKLAKAQEHATREIRKLQRAAKVKPDRDGHKTTTPEPRAPEFTALTVEEEAAFAESFQFSPGATLTKLMKRTTGLSPEQFQQVWTNAQDNMAEREQVKASNQFLSDHQDDYFPTPGNSRKLQSVLDAEDLPFTAQNLSYAFQKVESELDPLPGETHNTATPAVTPTPSPTNVVSEVKPQRTGISGADTEPTPEATGSTPNVPSDLNTGTLSEQRDKYQRAIRAGGQSSR